MTPLPDAIRAALAAEGVAQTVRGLDGRRYGDAGDVDVDADGSVYRLTRGRDRTVLAVVVKQGRHWLGSHGPVRGPYTGRGWRERMASEIARHVAERVR